MTPVPPPLEGHSRPALLGTAPLPPACCWGEGGPLPLPGAVSWSSDMIASLDRGMADSNSQQRPWITGHMAAVVSVAAGRRGCATGQLRRAAPRRSRRHRGTARFCCCICAYVLSVWHA
eukprot:2216338-Pyramimonas_sp.AAC.1